ncbi:DUF881 domain-containing protein [Sanguibacter sp. HDW7]|uniref:DUF881 domain-containing protein n=1 Tax=Sanguibacter sp. HDW7 TaxID=2714931 RepID=UPI00140DD44B|nr:DUF881 domain-containing protein [Sanguibacter sp. HDW7]QIK83542.1 DUF881 domain-containing protein [Sanguibacter sp. HDW7]
MKAAPDARTRPTRPDASMVLLDEVMRRPLDPGYAEEAARRRDGSSTRGPRRTVVLTLVAVLLGAGTAAATVALQPKDSVLQARSVLQEEILERAAEADAAAQEILELDARIDTLQNEGLADTYPALLERTLRDGASAGTVAVTGPGLVVTMRDAVPLLGEKENESKRVLDYDLQVVVNALWASGAQAIAVNGHRLTATSAIRSAGEAILVDLVGLSSPYTVEAIGDPSTLPAYFARSVGQQHLTVLASRYAITSDVRREKLLQLPAGRVAETLLALPPKTLGSSTSPSRPDGVPTP